MVVLKIKQERKVRLDELIKYAWNNKFAEVYYDQYDHKAVFDDFGGLKLDSNVCFDSRFTITEVVDITEDSKLNLVEIYKDKRGILEVEFHSDTSVNELLGINEDFNCDTQFIQVQNPDGSIGELIWSKERGLVE